MSAARPLSCRFYEKASFNANGCLIWTGYVNSRGYGVLFVKNKSRMATHIALELAGQPRPFTNFIACHHCDNPLCVNPNHLFWGTQRDNINDAVRKGRWGQAPQRRLTPKQEAQVIEARKKGETIMSLARKYNVSKSLIHLISTRAGV